MLTRIVCLTLALVALKLELGLDLPFLFVL
jgi:hypothetical protein